MTRSSKQFSNPSWVIKSLRLPIIRSVVCQLQLAAFAAFIFCPSGFLRADDPETWEMGEPQKQFSVGCEVTNGADPLHPRPGQTRQLTITPEVKIWDTWIGSNGGSYQDNLHFEGATNAAVSYTVEEGDGTVSESSQTVVSTGYGLPKAVVTFTMGNSQTTKVRIDVVHGDMVASEWVTFDQPPFEPETWEFMHSQSTVVTSMCPMDGTTELQTGQSREIFVQAHYQTWEVWRSNYENEEIRNFESGPAAGAVLSWSGCGDGTLSSIPETTDSSGVATTTFTMGSTGHTLDVAATYGSIQGSGSRMSFTIPIPEEHWTYTATQGSIGVELTPISSTSTVPAGTEMDVRASVTYQTWEIWTSDLGNTQVRNSTVAPAVGAAVSHLVESGDATIVSASNETSSSGQAMGRMKFGSQNSRLRVSVSYLGTYDVFATVDFTAQNEIEGIWVLDHQDGWLTTGLHGSLENATASLYGTVQYVHWDVYRHTLTNQTEVRNYSSGTASGAELTWTTSGGEAVFSSASPDSDIAGSGAAVLTLSSPSVRVRMMVSYLGMLSSKEVIITSIDNTVSLSSDPGNYAAATGGQDSGEGTEDSNANNNAAPNSVVLVQEYEEVSYEWRYCGTTPSDEFGNPVAVFVWTFEGSVGSGFNENIKRAVWMTPCITKWQYIKVAKVKLEWSDGSITIKGSAFGDGSLIDEKNAFGLQIYNQEINCGPDGLFGTPDDIRDPEPSPYIGPPNGNPHGPDPENPTI